jgi:hypothetical protein
VSCARPRRTRAVKCSAGQQANEDLEEERSRTPPGHSQMILGHFFPVDMSLVFTPAFSASHSDLLSAPPRRLSVHALFVDASRLPRHLPVAPTPRSANTGFPLPSYDASKQLGPTRGQRDAVAGASSPIDPLVLALTTSFLSQLAFLMFLYPSGSTNSPVSRGCEALSAHAALCVRSIQPSLDPLFFRPPPVPPS